MTLLSFKEVVVVAITVGVVAGIVFAALFWLYVWRLQKRMWRWWNNMWDEMEGVDDQLPVDFHVEGDKIRCEMEDGTMKYI